MKKLLPVLLLLVVHTSFAQKRAVQWYFGNKAGLSFTTTPVSTTTNGKLNSSEGCASISDMGGNLLFYTDGTKIWNRDHAIMDNGNFLLGNTSSTQSAIIVPNPANKFRYYVFTNDQFGGPNGLRYSEVDMLLDDGKGAVINTSKNTFLWGNVTEKLTAVKNIDGSGTWVIAHKAGYSQFISFFVGVAGVSSIPVTSDIGSDHLYGGECIGAMKTSPDGRYLACAVWGGRFMELFNFDNVTGKVTFGRRINYPGESPYGVEFSPDNSKLYVSASTSIYQYELRMAHNENLLKASEFRINTTGTKYALQLGPDGVLYIAKGYINGNYLSAILQPNLNGVSCNFSENHVPLPSPTNAVQGLPNFITSYLIERKMVVSDTCLGDSTSFSYLLEVPDSLKWDFGDINNNYSSEMKPKHVYSQAGVYTVKLLVYNGLDVDTFQKVLHINPYPEFSLGSDTVLCIGSGIVLNPGISGASYIWQDGKTLPVYLATKPGTYHVIVKKQGCISRDTLNITFDNTRVKATALVTEQCQKGNLFSFTSDLPNGNSYEWNFGDGTTGYGDTGIHTYTVDGRYNVIHKVRSTNNCYIYDTVSILVNPTAKAVFTVNAFSQCLNNNAFVITDAINRNASIALTRYAFSTGETFDNISSANKTFGAAGKYSISFTTLTNKGCKDSASAVLTVNDIPQSLFAVNAPEQCFDGNNFECTNNSIGTTGANPFQWKINNATESTSRDFIRIFQAPGAYKISLIVSDENGCYDTLTRQIDVNADPKADFSILNDGKCLGTENITFQNTAQPGTGKIISYNWDFGDNTFSSLDNPLKNYTLTNRYKVQLSVTDDKGCVSSTYKMVSTFEQPNAAFEISEKNNCEDLNAFDFLSTSTVKSSSFVSQIWKIGNIVYNVPQINDVHFSTFGNYPLQLVVTTSDGCSDTVTGSVKVHASPKADFKINSAAQCLVENLFIMENNSQIPEGKVNFVNWSVSDGRSSVTPSPQFVFTQPGNYTVDLLVTSDKNCKASITKTIAVHPQPEIDFTVPSVCLKEPTQIDNRSTIQSGSIAYWSWDMGDTTLVNSAAPQHIYRYADTFDISVVARSDKGCSTTVVKKQTAYVYATPEVDFVYRKIKMSDDQTVFEFLNNSDKTVSTYAWYVDGVKVSETENPYINFADTGYHKVRLTASNDQGCQSFSDKYVFVIPVFDINIPNAFTPNGDGLNETFGPESLHYIRDFKFFVLNRWGQIVFYTQDMNGRWDGTSLGKPVQDGVYTYKIYLTDLDGIGREFEGFVNLMN